MISDLTESEDQQGIGKCHKQKIQVCFYYIDLIAYSNIHECGEGHCKPQDKHQDRALVSRHECCKIIYTYQHFSKRICRRYLGTAVSAPTTKHNISDNRNLIP